MENSKGMGTEMAGKRSRRERQKEIYDAMLTPMKDFYDFSRDCCRELGRQRRQEKVFREVLLRLYLRQETGEETVEAAVSWAAARLSDQESQEALLSWHTGQEKEGEAKPLVPSVWEQTLSNWCAEDSFPYLSVPDFPAGRRDVLIYVLLMLKLTVKESRELLEELGRRKDRDEYRRLYELDLKESVFLFFMEWNTNHPEKQISYRECCSRFAQYGRGLLLWLEQETVRIERKVQRLLADEEKRQEDKTLTDLRENYKRLWERIFGQDGKKKFLSPVTEEELWQISVFDGEVLEDMKRLLAVLASAGHHIDYGKVLEKDEGLKELYRRNAMTRADRGTRAAVRRTNRLTAAAVEDVDMAFSLFCKEMPELCCEAHWRMYSAVMRLYAQAGKDRQEEGFLTGRRTPSMRTYHPREYRNLSLTGSVWEQEEAAFRLSFSYGGAAVNRLIEKETANGRLMTELLTPVLQNDTAVFGGQRQDSSVLFHLLKNNYQDWLLGKRSPYQSYKRETILKVLLAAGIDTVEKLSEYMELSGSPGLNLFRRSEASAYLMLSYRQRIRRIYQDLCDMEYSREEGFSGEEHWEQCAALLLQLPPELRPPFRELALEEEGICRAAEQLMSEPDLLSGEVLSCVEDYLRFPVVYDLKRFDLLCLFFEEQRQNRTELFYGPYTGDFCSKTVTERRREWVSVWKAAFRMTALTGRTKEIFRLWQEGMEMRETFCVERPGEEDVIKLHTDRLCRELEEAGIEAAGEKLRGNAEEILQEAAGILQKAEFLSQDPAALEAEAVLEFLLWALAALERAGIEGKAFEAVKYQVSRCVQSFLLFSGIHNMSLRSYRKLFACEQYSPSGGEDRRQNQILMWERIHGDLRLLEAACEWLLQHCGENSRVYEDCRVRLFQIYDREFRAQEDKFLREKGRESYG